MLVSQVRLHVESAPMALEMGLEAGVLALDVASVALRASYYVRAREGAQEGEAAGPLHEGRLRRPRHAEK